MFLRNHLAIHRKFCLNESGLLDQLVAKLHAVPFAAFAVDAAFVFDGAENEADMVGGRGYDPIRISSKHSLANLEQDFGFWGDCERRWGQGQGYRHAISEMTDLRFQSNYEEAHRRIKQMRIIAEQGGETRDQATFVINLLAKHHAKRNFIKLMSDDPASRQIRR